MITHKAADLIRIIQCLGSVPLADQVEPRAPTSSSGKDEGYAAHWAAKAVWTGDFSLEELNDRKAPNGFYITPEISAHVERYLDSIGDFGAVDVPTYLQVSDGIAITGQADHICFDGHQLHVNAFHYGYRLVPAVNNWSMIAHAVAFCIDNNAIPETVTLTVHQPRAYRPSSVPASVTMTYGCLNSAYEHMRRELTADATPCNTGPACTTCPNNYACAAFNSAAMNALDVSEMVLPAEPELQQLSELLDVLERAEEIIKAKRKSMVELALHNVETGRPVPGWGIEQKPGAMTWNKGMTAEMVAALTGKNAAKNENKTPMITPTQFKNAHKLPDTIMQTLAYRPTTAPQLVRMSAEQFAVNAAKAFNPG